MQFIEKNSFNVRSAVYHLKRDGAPDFHLFPMIHVGSQAFYDEVAHRLEACDLILAEGVAGKRANLLTLSYSVVKHIKRMDLVTQQSLKTDAFRSRIRNSDMTGQAFDSGWSSLPVWLRVQVFFLFPAVAVYLLLFGNKETIAEKIALEDLPSSEEVLFSDEVLTGLDSLLIDERDRILLGNIKNAFESEGQKSIAVVYGAMHMRNVMDFLMQALKYKVAKAEWITVFDL